MPNQQPPIAPLTFCGRHFSISEVEMIREVAAQCSALSLTEISRTLCELLDWKRPNGKLKNHECRLLLERWRDQGQLSLPTVQPCGGRGPRRAHLTSRSAPQAEITGSAGQFEPLCLSVVGAEEKENTGLWAEYLERYHYLGYRVPVGASPATGCVRSAAPSRCWPACCGLRRLGRWRRGIAGSAGAPSNEPAIFPSSSITVVFCCCPGCE